MQTKKTLSNNKIIALVAFICCALMASLFVYHLSHKQQLTTFADGNATLFPIGRDIKPFKLASTNGPVFSQKDLNNHWTLAFFGFTHCASICPATLNMLAQSYASLHSTHPTLQIVFISLDPERDNINQLTQYVHSFHPAFTGVAGKIQDIRKLQSQFGIFSDRDQASDPANYQLLHTPSILLIDPHGKWVGIFKSGIPKQAFIAAVNASIANNA